MNGTWYNLDVCWWMPWEQWGTFLLVIFQVLSWSEEMFSISFPLTILSPFRSSFIKIRFYFKDHWSKHLDDNLHLLFFFDHGHFRKVMQFHSASRTTKPWFEISQNKRYTIEIICLFILYLESLHWVLFKLVMRDVDKIHISGVNSLLNFILTFVFILSLF